MLMSTSKSAVSGLSTCLIFCYRSWVGNMLGEER